MQFIKIKKTKSSKPKARRIVLSVIGVALLILLSIGAYLGYQTYKATGQIITRNDLGGSILFHKNANDVKPADLTGDSDGRVNILLLGVGGGNHPGAYLTDTIQVLSLDTQNHKAAMLSVPRDLYYKYSSASYGRINEIWQRGEVIKKSNGPTYSKQTISDLLGIPIHYYILVDFQAFRQLVDTLGGITVNVEQPLDDCNYPNEDINRGAIAQNFVSKSCKSMEGDYIHIHFNAGVTQMNGDQALIFARSRHSTNDFDRSHRQQLIMAAIKQKALSAGILSNPLKLSQLIGIFGDHVRTDMQISDMQALAREVKDIDTSQLISEVIDASATGPLAGQTIGGADVLVPKDGDYTYQAVKTIAHEIFTNPYLVKENSTIVVENATGKSGVGASVASQLKTYGYNVVGVTNSPSKELFTQVIDYSGGKRPFTASFLEKRFVVKAEQATKTANIKSDFVVIIGADYGQNTSTR